MEFMATTANGPSRARYHHGDLRNALLEAALALVSKRGVETFSLREAARAVGVSPAAAYRHFEDKAALLAALAAEGMGRLALAMEGAMARAAGAPGSAQRATAEFTGLGAAYVEFAVANPARFRVMFGPWCDHPELCQIPPEAAPSGRDPYQILVDALDGLVRAGVIGLAARAGAEIAAWSSVHGLATLLVEGSLKLSAQERAGALLRIQRTLLLGLGAAPAGLSARGGHVDSDPRPGKGRRGAGR